MSALPKVDYLCRPPGWPAARAGRPAHIAVLDSSFNPPNAAHLALLDSSFPPPIAPPSSSSLLPDLDPGPYTARLLLYSPRNADKTPKAGDASISQRIDMMRAQAAAQAEPAAIAVLEAPTFVIKAAALSASLSSSSSTPSSASASAPDNDPAPAPSPSLTFLVGTDTLVRIFDPKYYPPNGGMHTALAALFQHAWLVSVRRGTPEDLAEEDALLASPAAAEWVSKGKIRVLDPVVPVSSTMAREAMRKGEDITGLVSAPVKEYILREGLYRE